MCSNLPILSKNAKYILLVLNCIILVLGIVIVYFGAKLLSEGTIYHGIAVLFMGVLLVGASFLGAFGAYTKNNCTLRIYKGILIGLLVFQVIITISFCALVFYIPIVMAFTWMPKVSSMYNDYLNNPNEVTMEPIDKLQQKLECCGKDGYAFWSYQNLTIPDSCYQDGKRFKMLFKSGCMDLYTAYMMGMFKTIHIVLIVVFVVNVASIVFACMM